MFGANADDLLRNLRNCCTKLHQAEQKKIPKKPEKRPKKKVTKLFTGGEGCYKHQVATGKLTSASRPCDLRKNLEGDGTQKAVAKQAEATQADGGRRMGSLPFSEYVRFETEQGEVLLYVPSALDRWIGMSILR